MTSDTTQPCCETEDSSGIGKTWRHSATLLTRMRGISIGDTVEREKPKEEVSTSLDTTHGPTCAQQVVFAFQDPTDSPTIQRYPRKATILRKRSGRKANRNDFFFKTAAVSKKRETMVNVLDLAFCTES